MLGSVKVSRIGPLEPTVLRQLGRVNVICGKNNSGKSTVLAALASPQYRAIGGPISQSDADQIAAAAADSSPFRRGSGNDSERGVYTNIVSRYLVSRELWFADDSDSIRRDISASVQQNSLLYRYQVNVNVVAEAVVRHIGEFPSTVLVPPKRMLQLSTAIKLSDAVEPSGEGLLNYLFYAKNQPADTDERRAYDAMLDAFQRISSGFSFGVFAERNNNIALNFGREDGSWVPAGACGLGLQDLLVLLYFMLVAAHDLLLIEEPESHMHPDMQRRLLAFVRDETAKQLFVTTHSNVFLNNALVDRVLFTTFEDSIRVDDATKRASILDDLGYSVTDNLVSDLVILVEGPSDVPVVEEFLRKDGISGRFDVKIWPLGGDIMDQVDLSVFAERYNILALIDRDPDSARVRRRFTKKCKDNGVAVHQLKRYSIENYFSLDALRTVFGSQVPDHLVSLDQTVKLSKQLGFDVKKRNRAIAREMTLTDIADTDLAKFFSKVREALGCT